MLRRLWEFFFPERSLQDGLLEYYNQQAPFSEANVEAQLTREFPDGD